jgi:DNA-binding MarR family transcriptional regulator
VTTRAVIGSRPNTIESRLAAIRHGSMTHFEHKNIERMTQTIQKRDRGLTLPDVLQFMQLLWAVVHGLQKTSKRMGRQIGVTGPQRLVLRVIGLFPGLSAGELAAILHVHPSTLTGVLLRLATQDLIVRGDSPHDRRRAVLHLTPKGARVNVRRRATVEAAVAAALEGLSARDRSTAMRVLDRVATHLDRATDHPGRSATPSRQVRGRTAKPPAS